MAPHVITPSLGAKRPTGGYRHAPQLQSHEVGLLSHQRINLHGLQTHFVAHSFSRPVHPQHATAWLTWGLLHAKPRRGFTFTILHPHIGRATEWLRM